MLVQIFVYGNVRAELQQPSAVTTAVVTTTMRQRVALMSMLLAVATMALAPA